MILEAVAGTIVIACASIAIYLLSRPGDPVSIDKTAEGGQYVIRIRANKDLLSVALGHAQEHGGLFLKRTGLKKGEEVRFQVPVSLVALMVQVEDEGGTKSYVT